MPLRKRPHHLVMPFRDSRCCYNPYGPHTMTPSCLYLTVPAHPRGEAGGLLCPGPGLRAACSSRNPNSTGRAPHSHPTEAPFWRRRAPTQFPALGTRHFQGRWGRCCARVPSRSLAARPQGAHNRRQARLPGMQGSWAVSRAPSQLRGATDRRPQNSSLGITGEPSVAH